MCYSDTDCQLATNDSVCRQSANSLSSDKDSVCMCREGFEVTEDKLHCRAVVKSTGNQ